MGPSSKLVNCFTSRGDRGPSESRFLWRLLCDGLLPAQLHTRKNSQREFPDPLLRLFSMTKPLLLLAFGFWAMSATEPPVWHPFGPFATREECDFVRLGLMRTGTFAQADSCEPDHPEDEPPHLPLPLPGEV